MSNNNFQHGLTLIIARVIGILFLVLGLRVVVIEMIDMFSNDGITINLFEWLIAYILVRGGYELFLLKESGRKLILVMLYGYLIILLVNGILGIIQGQASFVIKVLGLSFSSSNSIHYLLLLVAMGIVPGLLSLFLSGKRIKSVTVGG